MSDEAKALIELSELRIGNYLLYKGNVVYVTSLTMDIDDEYEDQIGFCKIEERSNEHSGWNRSLYNDLDRIPLSEEYFQKFGFEKSATSPYSDCEAFKIFKDASRLIWCAGDLFKPLSQGFVRITNYDFISNPNPIQFVHQLQNILYCLTGRQIKIDCQ